MMVRADPVARQHVEVYDVIHTKSNRVDQVNDVTYTNQIVLTRFAQTKSCRHDSQIT